MTAPVGDDLTWLDDLERAHAAATRGGWYVAESSQPVVAAVNAVPTLIAELRKRDAALRAVEALCGEAEERIRQSTPPITAERLIAEGETPTVTTGSIRTILAAALTPESVPT